MLCKENNYDFRARLDTIHSPSRRSPNAVCEADEFELKDGIEICFPADASAAVKGTAADLADYLLVSMKVRTTLTPNGTQGILLTEQNGLGSFGSYRITAENGLVTLTGADASGIRRAGVRLEDILNRRGGPFLKNLEETRTPLITPRIIHSGWGIEQFPDTQLNAMIHNGFDALAVFCKGMNRTNVGTLDFRDLIRRANQFGIQVYLYSYLPSYKHPDDADAQEFFDGVYTDLLKSLPGVAGVMLVGESAEFPSKDPATTGKRWYESTVDGIRDVKPSPGWWPCTDFPAWLTRVRDAIWKADPNLRIIFNTYNWSWASEEMRLEFLKRVPKGITIQITYDICALRKFFGLSVPVMDYSITAADPGFYFTSECKNAAACGLPILSTANTAGTTWDFGDVPYLPVPQRWIRRFRNLDKMRRECNLNAFYDCHHYGWWPSEITELGKAYFTSPQCDLDEELRAIAVQMAGAGADHLLTAWAKWSDAFEYLPATNEDQYGPLRVGPSYPLIFQPNQTRTMSPKEIKFPCDPNAHFGSCIIFTLYQPYENANQPPASLRMPREIKSLEKFDELWGEGLDEYAMALAAAPAVRDDAMEREYNIGKFIRLAARTCYNTKKWWQLNHRLQAVSSSAEGFAILDQISALLEEEALNAQAAVPLVEADSRLGWEPSMEYVCDAWHLDWKLRQLQQTRLEISEYRDILKLAENEGL